MAAAWGASVRGPPARTRPGCGHPPVPPSPHEGGLEHRLGGVALPRPQQAHRLLRRRDVDRLSLARPQPGSPMSSMCSAALDRQVARRRRRLPRRAHQGSPLAARRLRADHVGQDRQRGVQIAGLGRRAQPASPSRTGGGRGGGPRRVVEPHPAAAVVGHGHRMAPVRCRPPPRPSRAAAAAAPRRTRCTRRSPPRSCGPGPRRA